MTQNRSNIPARPGFGMVVGCALALTAALPSLRAQNAGAETVIRAESRVVLVDAVVADKKGKFSRDLAEKDFRVWEDGKEQKVSGFSLESSGVLAERPGKHYIVMYFDATTGGQLAVRQQADQFIDNYASPDRYMAVLAYNYNQGLRIGRNFTTDAAQLKRAVDSVQPSTGTVGAAYDYLESLRNISKSLEAIRGRKALVLFGAGAAVTTAVDQDMQDTILVLNKANVAVYSAGSGIGATSMGGGFQASTGRGGGRGGIAGAVSSSLSIASALADSTGGVTFLSSNELATDLGKIAQEQDQYYLLSYTPSVESAEGSCHELRVKADRSDLEVRARKSYCTEKPVDLLTGKPMGSELEARAASGKAATITASMQLPWFFSAPHVARVNLAMDIVPAGMKFQRDKGKLHGEFDLAAVATLPDGSIVARISDTVKLNFATQQQVDAFLATPYHYENQFALSPGQYNFRMAFSAGGEAFGKLEAQVKIEDWSGTTLTASAIALSRDVHPTADIASGLDPSLLEGQLPLVAKDTEVVPAGSTQFHNEEPAFFYIEVYEPLLAGAKADATLPPVGLRTRLINRASGQPVSDSGVKAIGSFMRPGNAVTPVLASLPIVGVPPGKYRLEVSVMRQVGDAVVRTVDFDVIP